MGIRSFFSFRSAPTGGVNFIYKQPSRPNLGDSLCTPKNYFTFTSDRSALIIGGGAYNDFGLEEANRFASSVRIAWAIGRSFRPDVAAKPLRQGAIARTFTLATTRDPQFATGDIPLLPCVSVLHPIVDMAPGEERGLFLNHDEIASGGNVDFLLQGREEQSVVATNSLPEAAFLKAFARAGEITTNSYHTAYWALLSGRSAKIVGYSTKFTNLLTLLGLDRDAIIPYRRGDSGSLEGALRIAESRAPLSLRDPDGLKASFRGMNLSFADSLGAHGIVARQMPRCGLRPAS